jgi:endothelin-converting enzyme
VFGNFNDLAKKNQQLIRQLLESDAVPGDEDGYDAHLLGKLRGLYGSCMNEDELDNLGTEPLLKVTRLVRELFNGKTTVINANGEKEGNLTAALAYLHSIGWSFYEKVENSSKAIWYRGPCALRFRRRW